jgi:hypothetical protein
VSFDEEPTQRVYRTDVGFVDWVRASAAAQSIVNGSKEAGDYRVLTALFAAAMRLKSVQTDAGVLSQLQAAQLLARLRHRTTTQDLDTLWTLLFKLFDVSYR